MNSQQSNAVAVDAIKCNNPETEKACPSTQSGESNVGDNESLSYPI